MATITEYLLARLIAGAENKDISVILSDAEQYCKVKRPSHVTDDSVKLLARKLYDLYPAVCYNPSERRIAKSPTKDIPRLARLIEIYGGDKVEKAIHTCIDPGKFIPNLAKFCNMIDTYINEPLPIPAKDNTWQ